MVLLYAARLVCNDYTRYSCIKTMLTKLNWPTLQQRRQQFKIIMMYKIINNLISVPHEHISATSLFISHGHGTKFIQLSARTAAYSSSFSPHQLNCGTPYLIL